MALIRRDGARRIGAALVAIVAVLLLAASAAEADLTVTTAPRIKGKATDGKVLKASTGKWTGAQPTFSISWERCEADGSSGCHAIGSGATHLATDADVGHTLRLLVTASEGSSQASAASAPSPVIAGVAPRRKKTPAITGAAEDGQLLSASPGTWVGTGPIDFSYQWESCEHGACAKIAGATAQSYRVRTADLAQKLRVVVTAANASGSATGDSKSTRPVVAGPPVPVAAPSVSGLPIVEQTLSAEPGTWAGTGPFTYSYQWRSCNLVGECEPISGAHEPTYTVGPLQIANSIEVEVTAHNAQGSASSTSPATSLIKDLLPEDLELPSITGLLRDGGLLSALTGAWSSHEALDFSYVWELCDAAGLHCSPVEGAAADTLGLVSAMVGDTVRVIVTATNGTGSTSATSEPTSLVKALLPQVGELPSISGLLQDGSSLTALLGSWTGTGPLSFSRQWELCDAQGEACKAIEGAIGSTLGLLTSEIGHTLRLAVTATNEAGSETAYSEPTSVIKALAPAVSSLPSVLGELVDTKTLTATLGSWSGSDPSFSERWELCNAAGEACKAIEGAVGTTLGLLTAEIGDTVRVAVTASNSAGSETAYSEPTSVIKALAPSVGTLPQIVGQLIDTKTLSGLLGSWKGSEPMTFSRQWELCNAAGEACKALEGAVGATLGLLTGEIGDTVRLAVTAHNGGGSSTAYSEPTSVIEALAPADLTLPSVSGLAEDGQTLSSALGSWEGSAPSFSERWELCNAAGEACKAIEGAVGSTLALLTSEIGSTVRLAVTATNSAGSTTAYSAPTSAILAILPKNTSAPSIGGVLQIGHTIEALTGRWSGSEPIKYSYQWQTCGLLGVESECTNLKGAVERLLKLELGTLLGLTVRVVVTATNARGSVAEPSPISVQILGITL